MMTLINLLTNPKTWVAVLAALVIGFMVYTVKENKHLTAEIAVAEKTIGELNTKIITLEEGVVIIRDDITALDRLVDRKDQLIIRETTIRTELEQIPQTIDRPLHDSNNFDYASRVRDYQRSITGPTRSNDN